RDVRGHAELAAGELDAAGPDERTEHGEILAHVAVGLGEREPEHRLDHQLMREAEAEPEAPPGHRLRGRRPLRHRPLVARKGRHDRGAELDARRLPPADRGRHDGVHAEDVGEPSAGETVRLRTLRLRHQAVDVRGSARDVPDSDADPHAPVYRSDSYDTIERAGPGKRGRRRPGIHPAMPCCRWAGRRSMWRVCTSSWKTVTVW